MTPEIEPMVPSERALRGSELPALVNEFGSKAMQLAGSSDAAVRKHRVDQVFVTNACCSSQIEAIQISEDDIRSALAGTRSEHGRPAVDAQRILP